MKLITKIILILILSITYSYSACNFKAELGIKRAEFESKEIVGAPLPLEYPNLDFYGILAEDICPEQNLKDIAIEYKFLNDELIANPLSALLELIKLIPIEVYLKSNCSLSSLPFSSENIGKAKNTNKKKYKSFIFY